MTELSRISDLKSDRAEALGAANGLERRIQDLQQTVRDVIAQATQRAPAGRTQMLPASTGGHVSVSMPLHPTLADIARINTEVLQIISPADVTRARDAEDAAQRAQPRLRHLRARAAQLDQLITQCERKYGTQP